MITNPILGWAAGLNRSGDETGTYHLLLAKDTGEYSIAYPACKTRGRTAGQVEASVSDESKCRTCKRVQEAS